MATTYDKHDAIKEMIAHRLDPEQAEAIARAIANLAGTHADHGDLVTKEDLRQALAELRAEMRGEFPSKEELRRALAELRAELHAELVSKADVRVEVAGLETRLTRWIIAVLMALLALLVTSVLRLTL